MESLGGCFAKQKQNRSSKQCHTDNKFYHAHNLTPFPGALIYIQTAFCRSIKQTNYKSYTAIFQVAFIFYSLQKVSLSIIICVQGKTEMPRELARRRLLEGGLAPVMSSC